MSEEIVNPEATASEATELSEEAKVNAEAAKEQTVKSESNEAVESPAVTNVKTTDKVSKVGKDSFDVQKSYTELRKEFTKRTQAEAVMRKELEELRGNYMKAAEQLAKLSEKPIDPEQFMRDFQTHGPKALDAYAQKYYVAPIKAELDAYKQAAMSKQIDAESKISILIRRADAANYPDFQKLENKMYEIIEKDPSFEKLENIDEMLDKAYEMARDRSSVEAIKAAEELGKQKAEAEIAKESRTTVATGGKSTGTTTPNLKTMDFEKLEKLVESLHGVADR